jgi:dTDP-4-dehydrorhamnose reductase
VREADLPTIIRPTTSDKFVRPAKRPAYSVLSSASLEEYGIEMPTWKDALERYLRERNEVQ